MPGAQEYQVETFESLPSCQVLSTLAENAASLGICPRCGLWEGNEGLVQALLPQLHMTAVVLELWPALVGLVPICTPGRRMGVDPMWGIPSAHLMGGVLWALLLTSSTAWV